jgi:hypothetical protein
MLPESDLSYEYSRTAVGLPVHTASTVLRLKKYYYGSTKN